MKQAAFNFIAVFAGVSLALVLQRPSAEPALTERDRSDRNIHILHKVSEEFRERADLAKNRSRPESETDYLFRIQQLLEEAERRDVERMVKQEAAAEWDEQQRKLLEAKN